jgi:hypothetical protein
MKLSKILGVLRRPQRLALAFVLGGLGVTGIAQAQVAGSSHDLSGGGLNTGVQAEICVYCHTPHAGAGDTVSAPLWNRSVASINEGDFTRYSTLNTTTLSGTEADVGSISLACLSCHDGVQSMDTVINAPGRGNQSGSGNAAFTLSDISLTNENANIGTDLRDDHPISIQYCGGGIHTGNATDAALCGNAGPNGDDYNAPQTGTINGNTVWWLDTTGGTDGAGNALTGTAGERERTDVFLYSRAGADFGESNNQPSVECGSCHDPHVASPDTTNEVNFMRLSNTNSAVCRACHNK